MDASKPFLLGCVRDDPTIKKPIPKNQTNNDHTLTEAPADGKHNHFQSPNFGSCVATLNSCVFFNLLDSK